LEALNKKRINFGLLEKCAINMEELELQTWNKEWKNVLSELQSKASFNEVSSFLKSKTEKIKSYSKVYILLKDTVNVGHAINGAAHASLSMYLQHKDNPYVQEWVQNSFRKVTCKVTEEEFELAKTFGIEYVTITESMLNGQEIALAFLPRTEFPEFFKLLKLYK